MSLVNSNKAVGDALFVSVNTVMLPICYPRIQHLPYLNVSDWDFFHGVDLQGRCMKHLLYCARCTFEYTKRYHLIKTEISFVVVKQLPLFVFIATLFTLKVLLHPHVIFELMTVII